MVIPIPENELENYYVIYIYRSPSFSIPSRFIIPEHLSHIESDIEIKLEDVFNKQDELSELLEIGKLNLLNQSMRKNSNEILDNIYADLIDEMNKNNFIMVV